MDALTPEGVLASETPYLLASFNDTGETIQVALHCRMFSAQMAFASIDALCSLPQQSELPPGQYLMALMGQMALLDKVAQETRDKLALLLMGTDDEVPN